MRNEDITKYIEIYKEEYGEVLDRSSAQIHLEVLVEFAEMIIKESKNEDENYGQLARSSK
jgi:hypothetical protein